MKILFLNWRDILNPRAGGAERVTHEVSKYLVSHGHEVTLFTASFKGASKEEKLDGVNIIREGTQTTVHLKAFLRYFKDFNGRFDFIIEEMNTIPFFTPLYAKEKKLVYINQLAREVWFHESPPIISHIGFLSEPLYLQFYKNTPCITIAESGKKELAEFGIKKTDIIPMAIDFEYEQRFLVNKNKDFTLLFVGRVVPSKRVDHVIEAFGMIKKQIPSSKLVIVGSGDSGYIKKLRKYIAEHGIKDVEFRGRVSQEEKYELMSKSHVILVTSVKEGWGLIVTEANGLKTPAVVYNVSGLVDAVKDKETGLICTSNNPKNLCEMVLTLYKDKKLYSKLSRNAYLWSKTMTWDKTGEKTLEVINKIVDGKI